mgnify:CR=1 FL=1
MDAFLRLGLPRELVIDSDELDKVTRAASKAAHPDSGGESSLFEEVRKAGEAVLDARVPPLKAEVEALIAGLGELEASLVGRFKGFDDSGWESSLSSMAETARALAFVIKWRAQLRAATGKLFEALLGG